MKLSQLTSCEKKLSEIEIKGITNDSRKALEGYLYVNTSDVKQYDIDAVNNGAAAVFTNCKSDLDNVVYTENPKRIFAEASANWFSNPAKKLKLLGVTGTNGKTSVTYMVKAILEKAGKKVGLIGTNQNMICDRVIPSINTTPHAFYLNELFADMVDSGCEYVIMEVSSHSICFGHIEHLNFETAMFTNLTQDHLDYHGTMEDYYLAKKKLFSQCNCAVFNADDEYGKRLIAETDCKKFTYSVKEHSDYIGKAINCLPNRTSYELLTDTLMHIGVATGGEFTVYNSLCAIACARSLGISYDIIKSALDEFCGVKGRAEVVPNTKDFTVIIDYAHTPDGLKNILKTFKKCAKERLIVLFGCGGDRDKTKRPLMGEIASIYGDYVIVTSDNPRTEDPNEIIADIMKGIPENIFTGKVIADRREAIKFALSIAQKDDIIILAGKGHETYQIIGKEKFDFDEREIVKSFL